MQAFTALMLVVVLVKAAGKPLLLCQGAAVCVWYLLGGSGVTWPSGVVAGVGGFRSPAASPVELPTEDWGVCGPCREPPELAGRHKHPYRDCY